MRKAQQDWELADKVIGYRLSAIPEKIQTQTGDRGLRT